MEGIATRKRQEKIQKHKKFLKQGPNITISKLIQKFKSPNNGIDPVEIFGDIWDVFDFVGNFCSRRLFKRNQKLLGKFFQRLKKNPCKVHLVYEPSIVESLDTLFLRTKDLPILPYSLIYKHLVNSGNITDLMTEKLKEKLASLFLVNIIESQSESALEIEFKQSLFRGFFIEITGIDFEKIFYEKFLRMTKRSPEKTIGRIVYVVRLVKFEKKNDILLDFCGAALSEIEKDDDRRRSNGRNLLICIYQKILMRDFESAQISINKITGHIFDILNKLKNRETKSVLINEILILLKTVNEKISKNKRKTFDSYFSKKIEEYLLKEKNTHLKKQCLEAFKFVPYTQKILSYLVEDFSTSEDSDYLIELALLFKKLKYSNINLEKTLKMPLNWGKNNPKLALLTNAAILSLMIQISSIRDSSQEVIIEKIKDLGQSFYEKGIIYQKQSVLIKLVESLENILMFSTQHELLENDYSSSIITYLIKEIIRQRTYKEEYFYITVKILENAFKNSQKNSKHRILCELFLNQLFNNLDFMKKHSYKRKSNDYKKQNENKDRFSSKNMIATLSIKAIKYSTAAFIEANSGKFLKLYFLLIGEELKGEDIIKFVKPCRGDKEGFSERVRTLFERCIETKNSEDIFGFSNAFEINYTEIIGVIDDYNVSLVKFSENELVIFETTPGCVSKVNLGKLKRNFLDKKALARKYSKLDIKEDYELIQNKEEKEFEKIKSEKVAEILLEENKIRKNINKSYLPLTYLMDSLKSIVYISPIPKNGELIPILSKVLETKVVRYKASELLFTIITQIEQLQDIRLEISHLYTESILKDVNCFGDGKNNNISNSQKYLPKVLEHLTKQIETPFKKSKQFHFIAIITPVLTLFLKMGNEDFRNVPDSEKELTRDSTCSSTVLKVLKLVELMGERIVDEVDSFEKLGNINEHIIKNYYKLVFLLVGLDVEDRKLQIVAEKLSKRFSIDILLSAILTNKGIFSQIKRCRILALKFLLSNRDYKYSVLPKKSSLNILLTSKVLTLKQDEGQISELASEIESVFGLEYCKNIIYDFLSYIEHKNNSIRKLSSLAISNYLLDFPMDTDTVINNLIDKFEERDDKSIKNSKLSCITCLSNSITDWRQVKKIFEFLLTLLVKTEVFEQVLKTGIAVIKCTGRKYSNSILSFLDENLNDIDSDKNQHRTKEAVVIWMASLSEHICNDKNNRIAILNSLFETLKANDSTVQSKCAKYILELLVQDDYQKNIEEWIKKLMVMTRNKADHLKKGGAIGVASLIKAKGMGLLFDFGILDEIKIIFSNKTNCNGAILIFAESLKANQKTFEPFLFDSLQLILETSMDNDNTKKSLEYLFDIVVPKISLYGLKLLLNILFGNMSSLKWRLRLLCIKLIEKICVIKWFECISTKQKLKIIRKLLGTLKDSNLEVKKASEISLKSICLELKIPELSLSNIQLYKALVKKDDESLLSTLKLIAETEFFYKFEDDFFIILAFLLRKAFKTSSQEIKTTASKCVCCLHSFVRNKSTFKNLSADLLEATKESLCNISPDFRTLIAFAISSFSFNLGPEEIEGLLKWSENVAEIKKVNKIQILAAAEVIANVLAFLPENKSKNYIEKTLEPKIKNGTRKVREEFFSALKYIPTLDFDPGFNVELFPLAIKGLSDESSENQRTAIEAGKAFLSEMYGFEEEAARVLLENIYDEDERVRVAVVELTAMFLVANSPAIEEIKLTSIEIEDLIQLESTKSAKIEKYIMKNSNLKEETTLELLASIYFCTFDVNHVAVLASRAWKAIVYNRGKMVDRILPALTSAICLNLRLDYNRNTSRKALRILIKNSSNEIAISFMNTLRKQSENKNDAIRMGMLLGVNQVLESVDVEFQNDFPGHFRPIIAGIVGKAISDANDDIRKSGVEMLKNLLAKFGEQTLKESLSPFLNLYTKRKTDLCAPGKDSLYSNLGLKNTLRQAERSLLTLLESGLFSAQVVDVVIDEISNEDNDFGSNLREDNKNKDGSVKEGENEELGEIENSLLNVLCSKEVSRFDDIQDLLDKILAFLFGKYDFVRFESAREKVNLFLSKIPNRKIPITSLESFIFATLRSLETNKNRSKIEVDRIEIILERVISLFLEFYECNIGNNGPFESDFSKIILSLAFSDIQSVKNRINKFLKNTLRKLDKLEIQSWVKSLKELFDESCYSSNKKEGIIINEYKNLKTCKNVLENTVAVTVKGLSLSDKNNKIMCVFLIEHVLSYFSSSEISPHVLRLIGPLVRFVNDDLPDNAKKSILTSLGKMIKKCEQKLKPFFSQIQTSLVMLLKKTDSEELYTAAQSQLLVFLSLPAGIKGLNRVVSALKVPLEDPKGSRRLSLKCLDSLIKLVETIDGDEIIKVSEAIIVTVEKALIAKESNILDEKKMSILYEKSLLSIPNDEKRSNILASTMSTPAIPQTAKTAIFFFLAKSLSERNSNLEKAHFLLGTISEFISTSSEYPLPPVKALQHFKATLQIYVIGNKVQKMSNNILNTMSLLKTALNYLKIQLGMVEKRLSREPIVQKVKESRLEALEVLSELCRRRFELEEKKFVIEWLLTSLEYETEKSCCLLLRRAIFNLNGGKESVGANDMTLGALRRLLGEKKALQVAEICKDYFQTGYAGGS